MKSKVLAIAIVIIVILATAGVVYIAYNPTATAPGGTASNVIYVATNGNDNNDGLSQSTAKLTLNGALVAMPNFPSYGTIMVSEGRYSGDGNKDLSIINKNVNFFGAGASKTVIEIGGTGWSFFISASNVIIRDISMQNGSGVPTQSLGLAASQKQAGGAIANYGNLTLERCDFRNNGRPPETEMGGAIFNAGTLTVTDTSFDHNSAVKGGAIYNLNSVNLLNSTFTSNSVIWNWMPEDQGGAIFNDGAMNITQSVFSSNRAIEGGAIFNKEYLHVLGSTFSINEARFPEDPQTMSGKGAAIFNAETLVIDQSAFNNNMGEHGGAIINNKITSVSNSSFAGNSAENGGALQILGKTTVRSTSFTNNHVSHNGGAINVETGYCDAQFCDFTNNQAELGGAFNSAVSGSNLNYCRLIGNSDTNYVKGDSIWSEVNTDARYNWWGENYPDLDQLAHSQYGTVKKEPYMMLREFTSYNVTTDSGTITTTLCYDSDGVYHAPNTWHFPIVMMAYYEAAYGSVSATSTVFVWGSTIVEYSGDRSDPYIVIYVTVDSQKLAAEVFH